MPSVVNRPTFVSISSDQSGILSASTYDAPCMTESPTTNTRLSIVVAGCGAAGVSTATNPLGTDGDGVALSTAPLSTIAVSTVAVAGSSRIDGPFHTTSAASAASVTPRDTP